MHLMSFLSPLDTDLALVYPRLAPVRLLELLAERGIGRSRCPTRSSSRWAPNVLALGPRRALALEGNDETRRRMEAGGRRRRHLPRRRDLPQGRRRPDLPHPAATAHLELQDVSTELFEAIAAGDKGLVRELWRRGRSWPRRMTATACRRCDARCMRRTTTSPGSCSTRIRRSTCSTRPPSAARGARGAPRRSADARAGPGERRLHGPPPRGVLRSGGRGRDCCSSTGPTPTLSRAIPSCGSRRSTVRRPAVHSKLVALLLEHGADPNASQGGGFTSLHAAAQNGDRESVEALLRSGADRVARTEDGKTAAELAAAAGHDELGKLLG